MTTKPEVTVHGATIDDLPEIMRLLRIMHAEGGMAPLDEDCAREMFERALQKKEGIIGVVRGEGSEICAMLYLLITRQWYTTHYHIEELFNFTAPEYRRTNYADALIRYADHCAQALKIPLVIGVMTNLRMEAKVRLYRRRLGMPAGAFFVRHAQWVNETAPDLNLWKAHTPKHRRGRKSEEECLSLALGTAIASAVMPSVALAMNGN